MKKEILAKIAVNKKLLKVAHNIANSDGLGDDLFQHLFEVLLNYPDEKIIEAYEQNALDYLAIKIMSNSYHSRTSPFARQYRHNHNDYRSEEVATKVIEERACDDDENRIELEKKHQVIDNFLSQQLNQKNFYRLTLFKMWHNGDTYREIARKTNIPMRSIGTAIQGTIKELKAKCNI